MTKRNPQGMLKQDDNKGPFFKAGVRIGMRVRELVGNRPDRVNRTDWIAARMQFIIVAAILLLPLIFQSSMQPPNGWSDIVIAAFGLGTIAILLAAFALLRAKHRRRVKDLARTHRRD